MIDFDYFVFWLVPFFLFIIVSSIIFGVIRDDKKIKECEELDVPNSCLYEKCLAEADIGSTGTVRSMYELEYQSCLMGKESGQP